MRRRFGAGTATAARSLPELVPLPADPEPTTAERPTVATVEPFTAAEGPTPGPPAPSGAAGAGSGVRPLSRRWVLVGCVALALAVVAAGVVRFIATGDGADDGGDQAALDATVEQAVADALEARDRQPALASQVYDTILPSLVVVQAGGMPSDGGGLGTGVVVNQDGAILTALHVVEGATSIEVSFTDGSSSPATMISSQPDQDIAVLAVERSPEVIVPAVLGGGLRVGDEVFAVGHPLGLVGSLSAGVVSGLQRSIPVPGERTLEGLIQFDAAVNPGNSGGPLLNARGQVVGVVTALANPSEAGFFVGIGFAVPIASAGGAAGGPSQ